MQTKEEEIILDTDDKAAKKITVTGWVSRHNIFYGDNEQAARYGGCTHKTCDCGKPMTKGWTKCEWCRSVSERERYFSLPLEEWDEVKPVYSDSVEKYFFSADEIDEYLDERNEDEENDEENKVMPNDLRLVICKENKLREVSLDYWEDCLANDGDDDDFPKEFKEKLNEFNKFIETIKPISYSPSKVEPSTKELQRMNNLFDNNGAEFSKDRKYRYCLWRIWNENLPKVMYIGLNPSTAREDKNDNTITKLCKITKNNGFGGFYMMNLFAIVSADPKILQTDSNPLGDNNGWLEKIAPKCEKIVFAWGNFKEAKERAIDVMDMFKESHCLYQNKNGSPKHPLYCIDETKIITFNKDLLK